MESFLKLECLSGMLIFWGQYWLQCEQKNLTQPAILCSKLIIETLEQGVKDVQNLK